jgi:hypothetical protein
MPLYNVCALGKDADAERERLRLLSFNRFEDVKAAALSTFCARRKWIMDEKPLIDDILQQYPKFQSCAQLVHTFDYNFQ